MGEQKVSTLKSEGECKGQILSGGRVGLMKVEPTLSRNVLSVMNKSIEVN